MGSVILGRGLSGEIAILSSVSLDGADVDAGQEKPAAAAAVLEGAGKPGAAAAAAELGGFQDQASEERAAGALEATGGATPRDSAGGGGTIFCEGLRASRSAAL